MIPAMLRGQVAVAATDADDVRIDATGIQIPGVLDDLFFYDGDLGVVWDGGVPTVEPVGADGAVGDVPPVRRLRPGDHLVDHCDGRHRRRRRVDGHR